jgi:hypothetical protein
MSEKEKSIFIKVSTQDEGEQIEKFLSENGVEATLTKNIGDLDVVFQGENPTNKFEISIDPEDFEKARLLINGINEEALENVPEDYYLLSFTNDELIDVLINVDEWNEFDVILSARILKDRKIEINEEEIAEKRKLKQVDIEKPAKPQTTWMVLGYICALLGGFLGLIIGYFFWQAKNTLPDGKKVYAYCDADRKQAKIILFISAIIFPIFIFVRVSEKI